MNLEAGEGLYLVWEELDGEAVLVKPVPQGQHVLRVAGVVLDHRNHLAVLEYLLHFLLQEQHQTAFLMVGVMRNSNLKSCKTLKVSIKAYQKICK